MYIFFEVLGRQRAGAGRYGGALVHMNFFIFFFAFCPLFVNFLRFLIVSTASLRMPGKHRRGPAVRGSENWSKD